MARLFPVRSQFQLDTSGARRFAEAPSDSKGVEGKATASNSYPVLLKNKSVPFFNRKAEQQALRERTENEREK
ncbi:hypothetical protein [Stutzerimonas balearica]|jgi:hypothetical protein|uniref:hypothetical protein n=1 Tax=Stutzerimonas balearica TaxID=74829 RepID=UPI0011AF9D8F|nr:hypothetical protein [Stutzerimonas balearica]MCZ4129998.1 hypothetical protein [Stutzerimonas balearica]